MLDLRGIWFQTERGNGEGILQPSQGVVSGMGRSQKPARLKDVQTLAGKASKTGMIQGFLDWLSKNKEITIALIGTAGGILSGWLLKGEKDKKALGYATAKREGYESGQKEHADKIDRLEDRVSRIETALQAHVSDLRDIFARLSDNEKEVSKVVQNIFDCQESRGSTIASIRELMCLKITEMEKRLLHQLGELRQQAKEEKRQEAQELRAWIRDEVERLLD
jgi:chromosome segregation ATPase